VNNFDTKKYPIFAKFLNQLAKDLTSFYYSKLNRTFKVSNKLKGKGYDPVTTSDKAFEKFIRSKIKKKFPNHQVIGEEFGHKKSKSEFTWVIDPIDGTRSYVIGNPTWSNLISLNYKGYPILGLANFPILKKYYLNHTEKAAYVVENGKKRKLKVNKKATFKNVKVSAAFHGALSLNKQKKVPQILKLMQFPCSDALSYSHLAEGRLDIVIQCSNKIWDIHPLIPIIKAAGGYLNTWDNKDAIKGGNILVSSNKIIHNKFLKLLKPVC
jgi:myo-inositol-1(or 4)-monophosphatase